MTALDERIAAALRRAPRVDPNTARRGGNSLFAIDARDATRPEIVAWTTPDAEPRVIARPEFSSRAACELVPSPDGRWLALRVAFPDGPVGPDLALLFLFSRDAECVVSPIESLVTLFGEAHAETVAWLDEHILCARGRSFALERRDERDAWLVFDADEARWLDIVYEDARPSVRPADPDRAVIASAHLAPIARARSSIASARDADIAHEARRILHERIAYEITYKKAFIAPPAEALALLRQAIAMLPRWSAPRRELCRVLRARDDWEALRDAADDWCRAQPLDADAAFNRSVALARTGDPGVATDALRLALELDEGLRYDAQDEPAFDALRGRDEFDRLLREP